MNKNKTEIVFILDRSGSMSGLEADTIGGYNSMLKKQKNEDGDAFVTTILFDDKYEIVHDRVNIMQIKPLTEKEYYVRGYTGLLDAIGKTIDKVSYEHIHTSETQRAEKVVFIITTDGYENASKEYSYEQIKRMVELQQREYEWEFIFLGANIDAIGTAARCGIKADRAANYNADSKGTRLNFEALSSAVSNLRSRDSFDENWKDIIDKDFEERNKGN